MRCRRASQKARVGGKRRTHPRAGSCQATGNDAAPPRASAGDGTEYPSWSPVSRDATRRAACHLAPGLRGRGTNRTNRDFAGALALQPAARRPLKRILGVSVRSFSTNSRPALRAASGRPPARQRHDGHRGPPHPPNRWRRSSRPLPAEAEAAANSRRPPLPINEDP
jgi:hypothetical protein